MSTWTEGLLASQFHHLYPNVPLVQVIGIDVLSQTLLSVIVELTAVRHSWRIRHVMIQFIPIMASELGVGSYNDVLVALCLQWLKDKVFVKLSFPN